MSRITFDAEYNGEIVEVVTGWDRQLGYYHLTIYNQDEDPIWCGLDHLGFCRDISKIEHHLHSLVTNIPPGTIDLIDQREGNVDYQWDENLEKYNCKDYR